MRPDVELKVVEEEEQGVEEEVAVVELGRFGC